MRALLIITADQQSSANAWMQANYDAIGGLDSFTVPLNASGSPDDAPTHYWCAVSVTDDQLTAMQAQGWGVYPYDPVNNPTYTAQQATDLGVKLISALE